MMQNNPQITLGESFLLQLQEAESKGLMFAALEKIVATYYPQNDLLKSVEKLSDFYSVASYQSKLARIRIEYNARAVKEISSRIVGLNNFGQDNYKYKDKIVRKLNLLINNRPTLDEMIYITMASYVDRGYGSIESFKKEIADHIRENMSASGQTKLEIQCQEDVCQV
ncbi:MAG: hypothetical protein J6Y53_05305 [Alphaproteobacteria bacterium]|nr:hypothetical protein [Alphaproteobacteria bacterium]